MSRKKRRSKDSPNAGRKPPRGRRPFAPLPEPPSRTRRAYLLALRWRIKTRSFNTAHEYALQKHAPDSGAVARIVGLTGVGVAYAGWQIMPASFVVGALVFYAGTLLTIAELLFEPTLRRGGVYVRALFIIALVAIVSIFSVKVVFVKAPLDFDSYAMLKGSYPEGAVIAGIPWDSHLTDLRVWIKNPSNEDYSDLDVAVQPDKWTYMAAIVGDTDGCYIKAIGGGRFVSIGKAAKSGKIIPMAHREGGSYSVTDNAGNLYYKFIEDTGQRLICSRLPAKSEIQIVFALAAMRDEVASHTFPNEKDSANKEKGTWGMEASAWKGVTSKFDLLAPRPSPSVVSISGHYNLRMKKFNTAQAVRVGVGNQGKLNAGVRN